jgi:Recombinase zinc beta ribbon domain
MDEWDVLIKDHHAAYITWDEFERNLKAIANNATCMSSALARGAAREGELLLPGLLRCGHCGRKLHVHYGGKLGRYNCYGARTSHGTEALSYRGPLKFHYFSAHGRHVRSDVRTASHEVVPGFGTRGLSGGGVSGYPIHHRRPAGGGTHAGPATCFC